MLNNLLMAQQYIETSAEIQLNEDMVSQVRQYLSTTYGMVNAIVMAALTVQLVIAVYHVANNEKYGKGKSAIVNWFIAIIVYLGVSKIIF